MESNYTIGGVKVCFPCKAYPSQISMMDKIIRSLTKKQNCLLESPTGSGKSLALLCSSLAWQNKTKKEIEEAEIKLEQQIDNFENISVAEQLDNVQESCSPVEVKVKGNQFFFKDNDKSKNTYNKVECKKEEVLLNVYNDDDMDDFQPIKKTRLSNCSMSPCTSSPRQKNHVQHSESAHENLLSPNVRSACTSFTKTNNDCEVASSEIYTQDNEIQINKKGTGFKVPKIFFGTRTHKQISQIIRELKKTSYKNVKMTILSSRDRTCIHGRVCRADNKKEACDELLYGENGPSCLYYRNVYKINHTCVAGLEETWDLEDFVSICRKVRACPYFSGRSLLQNSDIIFCPYNYLIDPLIRDSLDINLNKCIIILDEAHNLEDSARDASSFTLKYLQLQEAAANIRRTAVSLQSVKYHHAADVFFNFCSWIQKNSDKLYDYFSFNMQAKVWSGEEMAAILNIVGLGPDQADDINKCFSSIMQDQSNNENLIETPRLLGSTIFMLKSFCFLLHFAFSNKCEYVSDYQFVVMKKKVHSGNELSANFWCLNPAVAVSDFKDKIHSLIVASGTLAPLVSFKSELNMPFEVTLEANHVVSNSQLWVGAISQGPSGIFLSATFRNSEMFTFQDEIGAVILDVCSIVPYGVLCFLPSYSMLDKMTTRWQATGLWDLILAKKVVVCEPRNSGKDFETAMNEFYKAVQNAEHFENEVNGALFIAVCRGKVSEGLDFTDSNARAVITVGIPFPNVKDAQVDLKRKYNDKLRSKKDIMSGSEWYETQAFRALNQALGRCIRHRNDFGALIIIDERFGKNKRYVGALSKWIRNALVHYTQYCDALRALSEFVKNTGLSSCVNKSVCNTNENSPESNGE